MSRFTAEDARNLMKPHLQDEFLGISEMIKKEAKDYKPVLHVYKPLAKETLDTLEQRGFRVFKHPSIDIQKDNLYYSIYWDKEEWEKPEKVNHPFKPVTTIHTLIQKFWIESANLLVFYRKENDERAAQGIVDARIIISRLAREMEDNVKKDI
jgi:hypothetical protein